jgi:hypothetical protein
VISLTLEWDKYAMPEDEFELFGLDAEMDMGDATLWWPHKADIAKRMVQTGPRKPFSGFVRLVTFVFEEVQSC